MKIAYIGRVSLSRLECDGKWDRPLPVVKWGFPLGSDIVLELARRGHEVVVITEHVCQEVEHYASSLGIEVFLVPCRSRSRWTYLTFFRKEIRGFIDVIHDIRPDVVFAQWTYYNAAAGLKSGYPTLVVAHDSPWRVFVSLRNLQTFIKAFYAQLFVFPKINHLTTVSPHMIHDLRRYNRYKDDIALIPNGVRAVSIVKERQIRKRAQTVVMVSQVGRLKNSQVLFKAWELIAQKHPDWRLLAYGQGMPNGIVTREELDMVLKEHADVFCSPTLEESFGMVFVEAMAQGVPCVGGRKSGAVPWILDDGHAGVLSNVSDYEELARDVEHLMLDFELRKKLSVAGQERVRKVFILDTIVSQYEERLFRICNSSGHH